MHLTPREKQIVEKVSTGKKREVIAEELDISPRTVDAHLAHARARLRVATTVQVVVFFVRQVSIPDNVGSTN